MAKQAAILEIRGFKGLNTRDDPSVIDDNELAELTNFEIGKAGELIKRTGIEVTHSGATLGNNPVRLLGHFLTDTYSQLIAKAGNNVYYSNDGINWTVLGVYSDAEWGVQYGSNFYIIRKNSAIIQWTGLAATSIAGSPSGTFGIIYKERLFILNSEATGSLNSRIYYSKSGDLSATGWVASNLFDVRPGDGDFLTSMVVFQDLLYLFKGRSTWALYTQPNPVDWSVRNVSADIGCISKWAIREFEGYLYISGPRAIYRTDGLTFDNLSDPIGVLSERVVNLSTYNIDSFGLWKDKIICLLSPDSATQVYYEYHPHTQGWSKWEFAGSLKPTTFLEVRTNTPQLGLYAGDYSSTGKIFRYGAIIYTDGNSNYECRVQSKRFDLDAPMEMKRGIFAILDAIGVATIAWTHRADHIDKFSGNASSVANRSAVKIRGPEYFRVWQLKLQFTSSVGFTLIGFMLQVIKKRTVIGANT